MPVVEVPGIGNVHFPDDVKPAEMSQAIQSLLQQQQAAGGTLPASGTVPSTATAAPAPTPIPQVTPEQVLAEEHGMIGSGLRAGATELMGAGSDIMTGGMLKDVPAGGSLLGRILGLARAANAPSVAAGGAVGTGVHQRLASVPGLGGAAGAVPAAGAALADAATQLATGGPVIKAATKGLKTAGQIAGSIFAPSVLRQAGREAVAGVVKAPKTVLERVFQTPASKRAYQLAEGQGAVKTQELANITEEAFFKSIGRANPNDKTLEFISNLNKKFTANKRLPYSDVMEEIQDLKAQADKAFAGTHPDNLDGTTLMKAREFLIEELDKISPMYRSANRLYRQEQATIDIMNSMRTSTPGTSIEKLIENTPDVAKAFTPAEIKEVQQIANSLNDVVGGVAGWGRQIWSAMSKPISQMLSTRPGRYLLRQSLTSPDAGTAQRVQLAVQLWRAGQGQE